MKKIGYKATNNFKCKSLTYEIGKTYEVENFSRSNHSFYYYNTMRATLASWDISKDFKLLEIEDLGDNSKEYDGFIITNKIKVLREVPVAEHKLFELDENENALYVKDSSGLEYWFKYDDKGNLIYYKDKNKQAEWKITITETQ